MLTKDLLRYQIDGDRIRPQLVQSTPAIQRLCEDLLAYWRVQIGATRAGFDEGLTPILYRSRSLVVAKGLNRVIEQTSTWQDPPDLAQWRWQVLRASAAALQTGAAAAQAVGHRRQVAADLALAVEDLDGLYRDLPEAACLDAIDIHQPATVIERYNLGLCQGLLLHANDLTITVSDCDVGRQRALMKALRFSGLLVDIQQEEEVLRLQVTGPGGVLDQTQRYGMNLARFLPAVASLPSWHLTALVRAPRREGKRVLRLELDERSGLRGHTRFLAQVPEELQLLRAAIVDKCPTWEIDEDLAPIGLPDGQILIPDLQVRIDGRLWLIECFHRWHHRLLARRLDDLQQDPTLPLVLGVDRALLKRPQVAALPDHPIWAQRVFLYAGVPNLRALTKTLTALGAGA